MKKKLNLLCAMIFAVLLLSLSENIYSMVWGAIEGGKAGMENKAGEINNLHPLMLLPDNLSSTSDSIYNEMTGKNVPIWQIQSMVTVDTDAPGWLALINTLLSFILIIFGIKAVLQFIKFIRNINPLGHLLLGKCKTVAQVRHLFADYFRRHFDQHLYAHLATFASIEDTRLFL